MSHRHARSIPSVFGTLAAGLAVLVACEAAGPSAPADGADRLSAAVPSHATTKVDVCHRDLSGDYALITLADAAYDTHVDHGDASPGDPVPGMDGYVFDAACEPVVAECPCFHDGDLWGLYGELWYYESLDGWELTYGDSFEFAQVSYGGSGYSCEIRTADKQLALSPISEAAANECVATLEAAL